MVCIMMIILDVLVADVIRQPVSNAALGGSKFMPGICLLTCF